MMQKTPRPLEFTMKTTKYFFSAIFILLTATIVIAQPEKTKVDGIIAVVGDKIITLGDVENQFLQYIREGGEESEGLKCQILENMMSNKLLLIQAEFDSLEITDEEVESQLDRRVQYFTQMVGGQVDKLEEFYGKSVLEIKEDFREPVKEQILSQKMRGSITEGLKVTPKEVKDYFSKIPIDSLPYFETEIQVGQIALLAIPSKASRDYTISQLSDLRSRIIEKGESFSTLATLYSEDPGSQKKGGDLGWFRRGEMVSQFEGAAFKLKPLEVSEVIETKFGFHIIQMIERRGDRIKVRHILTRPPISDSDLLKKKFELDTIRMKILKGEMGFEESVRRYSKDVDSKNNAGLFRNPQTGDNIFTISQLGQLPQNIYYNIKDLQEGELSSPVPYLTSTGVQGYRILYLKSKSIPHKANLEEDYEKIHNAALSTKRAEVIAEWFEENKKKTYIRIEPDQKACDEIKNWIAN